MSDVRRPDVPPPYESYTQPLPPSQDIPAAPRTQPLPPSQDWAAAPGVAPPPAMPHVMSPHASQSYYVPMTAGTARPSPVSAIAIWHWVLSGLYGLVILLFVVLGGVMADALSSSGLSGGGLVGVGIGFMAVLLVILLVIAGVLFMVGRGLWRMRNTGRVMAIVVDGLYVALTLFALANGGELSAVSAAGLLFSAATIIYLNLPSVRPLFR